MISFVHPVRGLLLRGDQVFREISFLWPLKQLKKLPLLLFALELSAETGMAI